MFFRGALLSLLAATVLASPIDLPSRRQHDTREVHFPSLPHPTTTTTTMNLTPLPFQCDAATISQIFDTLSYDPLSATAFCTQVLSANIDLKAFAPRLPKNRSPGDITAACQCIVTTSVPAAQAPVAPAQQQNRVAEAEELKLREAVPQAAALRYDPYGKGAEPVPLGSELKGFGGKVPYVRSGRVEGTRW
jgi:hypothetical protein